MFIILPGIVIQEIDQWLETNVSDEYKNGLAQHWARVAKISEEAGESISELIQWTGQNPRKGIDHAAFERLLKELADCVVTSIMAIQHFTGDTRHTGDIINRRLREVYERAGLSGAYDDTGA